MSSKQKKQKKHKKDKDEWVEKPYQPESDPSSMHQPTEERFDWMATGDLFKTKEREKTARELEKEEKLKVSEQLVKERTIVPSDSKSILTFGDKGSNWRMMKLKRAYEISKEEGRTIEEVALERYGTIQDFNVALKEREYLDSKSGNRLTNSHRLPSKGFLNPEKPIIPKILPKPTFKVEETNQKLPKTITQSIDGEKILNRDELNKLKSQLMKSLIQSSPNLKELQNKYTLELARYEASQVEVIILKDPKQSNPDKNLKQRETHDKFGNRVKYMDDDQNINKLDDMVRHEKMTSLSSYDNNHNHTNKSNKRKGGDHSQAQVALGTFQFLIRDFIRSKESMEQCPYCWHDGNKPLVSVLSLGLKVYLSLPQTIQMLPFHCLIVPTTHVNSTLELEDDSWDEIRNFQKSLMKMMNDKQLGVIFIEQVINLKWNRHVVIECIPVPLNFYEDSLGYYKESLLNCEEEWSQHQKVIMTDYYKVGFRNSLVSKLPYFHVWIGLDKGIGHVIEQPKNWDTWFGREVVGRVLGLDISLWRKPRIADMNEIDEKSLIFLKNWEGFDWTVCYD